MVEFINTFMKNLVDSHKLMENEVIANVVRVIEQKYMDIKAGTPATYEALLVDFQTSLRNANAYVKSDSVDEAIKQIDKGINEYKAQNPLHTVDNMANEFDIKGELDTLKESTSYKNPIIKEYIDSTNYQMSFAKIPSFLYLPAFVQNLSQFTQTDSAVSESINKANSYINENREKLIILETIYKLDATAIGDYKDVSKDLKTCLSEGNYRSDMIKLRLGNKQDMVPMVVEMNKQLASMEMEKNPTSFNLGTGDHSTKVFDYIGPAVQENETVIIPMGDVFLKINESTEDTKGVGVGSAIVSEVELKDLQENHRNFYDLVENFAALGFRPTNSGLICKLGRNEIEFKMNEQGDLDLYINTLKINEVKNIDFNDLFVTEAQEVKNKISHVLNNIGSIYHIEFVKFLTNESKYTGVVNIDKEYLVYDFMTESGKKIYKLDGSHLYHYISEQFNYDVKWAFNVELNETHSKFIELQDSKMKITNDIQDLEKSKEDLVALKDVSGVKESHVNKVEGLIEKIDQGIIDLKNQYILVEKEIEELNSITPISGIHKVGDTVKLQDGTEVKIMAKDGSQCLGAPIVGDPNDVALDLISFDASDIDSDSASIGDAPQDNQLPIDTFEISPDDLMKQGRHPGDQFKTAEMPQMHGDPGANEGVVNEDHQSTKDGQLDYLIDAINTVEKSQDNDIVLGLQGVFGKSFNEFRGDIGQKDESGVYADASMDEDSVKDLYLQVERFLNKKNVKVEEVSQAEPVVAESTINEDDIPASDREGREDKINDATTKFMKDEDTAKTFTRDFEEEVGDPNKLKDLKDMSDEEIAAAYKQVEDTAEKEGVKLEEGQTATMAQTVIGKKKDKSSDDQKKELTALLKAVSKSEDNVKSRFAELYKGELSRLEDMDNIPEDDLYEIYVKLKNFGITMGIITEAKKKEDLALKKNIVFSIKDIWTVIGRDHGRDAFLNYYSKHKSDYDVVVGIFDDLSKKSNSALKEVTVEDLQNIYTRANDTYANIKAGGDVRGMVKQGVELGEIPVGKDTDLEEITYLQSVIKEMLPDEWDEYQSDIKEQGGAKTLKAITTLDLGKLDPSGQLAKYLNNLVEEEQLKSQKAAEIGNIYRYLQNIPFMAKDKIKETNEIIDALESQKAKLKDPNDIKVKDAQIDELKKEVSGFNAMLTYSVQNIRNLSKMYASLIEDVNEENSIMMGFVKNLGKDLKDIAGIVKLQATEEVEGKTAKRFITSGGSFSTLPQDALRIMIKKIKEVTDVVKESNKGAAVVNDILKSALRFGLTIKGEADSKPVVKMSRSEKAASADIPDTVVESKMSDFFNKIGTGLKSWIQGLSSGLKNLVSSYKSSNNKLKNITDGYESEIKPLKSEMGISEHLVTESVEEAPDFSDVDPDFGDDLYKTFMDIGSGEGKYKTIKTIKTGKASKVDIEDAPLEVDLAEFKDNLGKAIEDFEKTKSHLFQGVKGSNELLKQMGAGDEKAGKELLNNITHKDQSKKMAGIFVDEVNSPAANAVLTDLMDISYTVSSVYKHLAKLKEEHYLQKSKVNALSSALTSAIIEFSPDIKDDSELLKKLIVDIVNHPAQQIVRKAIPKLGEKEVQAKNTAPYTQSKVTQEQPKAKINVMTQKILRQMDELFKKAQDDLKTQKSNISKSSGKQKAGELKDVKGAIKTVDDVADFFYSQLFNPLTELISLPYFYTIQSKGKGDAAKYHEKPLELPFSTTKSIDKLMSFLTTTASGISSKKSKDVKQSQIEKDLSSISDIGESVLTNEGLNIKSLGATIKKIAKDFSDILKKKFTRSEDVLEDALKSRIKVAKEILSGLDQIQKTA